MNICLVYSKCCVSVILRGHWRLSNFDIPVRPKMSTDMGDTGNMGACVRLLALTLERSGLPTQSQLPLKDYTLNLI